jgi:type VI secretion system secreted protein Hcp
MAVDYFLKLDGIDGESTDDKHKGEIEVESFSWGLANTAEATSTGRGTGKVAFQDFHFVSQVSKASPKLMLACASGEHIKEAILTSRKAGKEQLEFLIVKMTDVLVSSYQSGGAASSEIVPTDQISLNFAKLEFEYKAQKLDGSLDSPVSGGWDLKKNEKL